LRFSGFVGQRADNDMAVLPAKAHGGSVFSNLKAHYFPRPIS
jgi:hypothetical protein